MSIDLLTEYVVVTCNANDGGCQVQFAMTRSFYDETHRDRRTWYCPNGHPRVWSGPTVQQQLERAKARETSLRDQLEAAAREAESVRVALLRDRQRFANGVCPCCNRSFENVRRHMSTKHPDYDVTELHQRSTVRFACSCGRSFTTLPGLRRHQTSNRGSEWYSPDASKWSAHLTKV